MPRYWLMKSEPDEVSIDDLAAAPGQVLPWTGVRNYQARNFMRDEMRVGDGVLFYHSSCPEPGIAGLARIAGAPCSRRDAVRPRQPLLRPEVHAGQAALAADRRGAGAQDAAAAAARDAQRARSGLDARAGHAATGCRSRRSRPRSGARWAGCSRAEVRRLSQRARSRVARPQPASKRMLASVRWLPPRRRASASAPSQAVSSSCC